MKHTFKLAAVSLSLLLAACYLPEKMDANIEIDGLNYTFEVDAIIINGLALQMETFTQKDEDKLAKEAEKMKQDPEFKSASYLGKGRYEIEFQATGSLEERTSTGFPDVRNGRSRDNFLRIAKREDGLIEISSPKLPADKARELAELMPGTKIHVSVKTNGTVIEENASKKPGWLSSAYEWSMSSWDENVHMVIDPAK